MELNTFQQWCFNTPLQPQVLVDVKAVLSKNITDGISEGCVTMKGERFNRVITYLPYSIVLIEKFEFQDLCTCSVCSFSADVTKRRGLFCENSDTTMTC